MIIGSCSPPLSVDVCVPRQEWADDNVSTVTLTLEALSSAKTKLTLTQTDVPHDDKYGNHYQDDKVRGGWPQFFFSRINKVLGYANLDL
jgi:activator of HSP90 ATPase